MADKLTAKQTAFIAEYLKCLNGTEAARRALYKGDDNTLASVASENLRKPKIKARIDELMRESLMQPEEVLYRLQDATTFNVEDFWDVDGEFPTLNLKKARERGKLHQVRSIKLSKAGLEVKFVDPDKALELIGKYHQIFKEVVKIEDWRSEAIRDIRDGNIDYEALAEAFGTDLATELFRNAGVPVQTQ